MMEETKRQLEFLEQAKTLVQKLASEKGESLTAAVVTFGCQMNARDSEKLKGILERTGFLLTDREDSDFVIYNTCTVRENANNKVYGRLGLLKKYKERNKRMRIALCGCMMQEETVLAALREHYGFIDLVFGTFNVYKFPELLVQALTTDHMICDIWKEAEEIVEDLPNKRTYPFKAGVNISYGCDNFCSYCIVPYVRGRERSRKKEEILKECRALVEDGVKEIMLLGQNVNSYGKGLEEPCSFAGLLSEVAAIPELRRVRFMTSHPKDLSPELIHVIAEQKKICRHLHLPLQSGSSRILAKMNRHYTKEQYLSLTEKIREEIPDIALTTDLIVGFPGETEEDFKETLSVVRSVGFHSAFTFQYSKRTGTPAAALPDQIPPDVVKDRFDRLLDAVQEEAGRKANLLTGATLEVLVEEKNRQDPSLVTGRLSNNSVVHFPGDIEVLRGEIVPVKLLTSRGFYYMGEMA